MGNGIADGETVALPQVLRICILAALRGPTGGQGASLPGMALRHHNEREQCENNTKPKQRKESYSGQNEKQKLSSPSFP